MIDFPRYLAAKVTVDDRALNRYVWERLTDLFAERALNRPLQVLELGCGIGTMVERLLSWGLAERVNYLGIDSQVENIHAGKSRLMGWGSANGYEMFEGPEYIALEIEGQSWQVSFEQADATAYKATHGNYDLLIANAFLDLIDVPGALPDFARWLKPDGLFYFTINFDGGTIFEPVVDQDIEPEIIALYHQTMDLRQVAGRPSGDSRTGRHLFSHLRDAGAQILASGASDWVVYPGPDGYIGDEAYFLHCILDFFMDALKDHPDLPSGILDRWLTQRRQHIAHSQLVYIAHQLDFLGGFS